jgi:hypothetical protein
MQEEISRAGHKPAVKVARENLVVFSVNRSNPLAFDSLSKKFGEYVLFYIVSSGVWRLLTAEGFKCLGSVPESFLLADYQTKLVADLYRFTA